MPKRVVDGEGVWRSKKIKQLKPEYRAEYANLIPLAAANGVFEADPDRVWSDVYSYNREDVTPENVADILADMERVGLLRRWTEGEKVWGYWEGIDKAGRLPKAHLDRYKHLPPGPPPEIPSGTVPDSPGESETLPTGFGSGIGIGSGLGLGPAAQEETNDCPDNGQEEDVTKKQAKEAATRIIRNKMATEPGNSQTVWDLFTGLVADYGSYRVMSDLEEWAKENRGDDFPHGPLSVYVRVAADRLAEESKSAEIKSPAVTNLTRELAYLYGGSLGFNDKHRIRLAELLKEYTAEEIIAAWRAWVPDHDDNPKYTAGNFVQAVDDLCYAARRLAQEKAKESAARDAAAIRLQESAEADRRLAEEREKEEESFELPE